MLSSEEDRERFTLLYEAHEKRLYAVALKILENPTRAEDAAQQAWLQVLRNWERVNALDWDAAARYLAVAAKNAALDLLKKWKSGPHPCRKTGTRPHRSPGWESMSGWWR